MTMTRNHFEDLAQSMRHAHPRLSYQHDADSYEEIWMVGAITAWADAVQNLADFCGRQNPRFDRDKFIRACTPAGL